MSSKPTTRSTNYDSVIRRLLQKHMLKEAPSQYKVSGRKIGKDVRQLMDDFEESPLDKLDLSLERKEDRHASVNLKY